MPPYIPRLRRYQDWLERRHGLQFADYESLWRWSVTDQAAFWQSLWDFEGMSSPTLHTAVLAEARMPGARWFPGAQANFARRLWRQVEPGAAASVPAIVAEDETGRVREIGWRELRRQIASMALALRSLGVQRGDRVVAVLPNGPEAAVSFYAAASIGAVWSQCAPDMGARAVVDRFRQITPRVLIAADGVHHAGRPIDRTEAIAALRAELPSVAALVRLGTPWASGPLAFDADFDAAVARDDAEVAAFEPEWLPFDHPLWIVYSSGTTGAPKALVHGHGGIQLMAAASGLHNDLGPSHDPNSLGERFHWFSSTGWIMWNLQVGALTGGTTICLFDGSPGGPRDAPDWTTLWRFAARHGVTWFGSGAAFYANVVKAGVNLAACGDLSRIRALGSTGSPLAEDVQRAVSAQFARLGTPDIWWHNISGGTDFCGAFLCGSRLHRQVPGRMECRQLGAAVESWNDVGEPVIDEVGELVCTRPLPSMPLYLWNDPGGERYRSSYFDLFPGVWRHGDWLRLLPDGSGIIYGRSDATINRHGLRLGTSEIYAAVEALPEVLDSLVIDLEVLGEPSWMALFVVLRPGHALDDALRGRIAQAIRAGVSPRFVPDAIVQAPEVPRTLSGKKQEVPVKRLFLGHPVDKVLNRDAMANPACLDWYLDQARARRAAAPLSR
jgi:acetoacetyl-CoA synthetase